jgi:uncharacterized protein YlxW (UPF0749 family)
MTARVSFGRSWVWVVSLLLAVSSAAAREAPSSRPAEDEDTELLLRDAKKFLREALTAQAQAAKTLDREVATYHRRADEQQRVYDAQVAEQQRQYEEAQSRGNWVYVFAVVLLVPLVGWGVIATRASHRKQDEAVRALDASRAQGDRMIAILEAIERKLPGGP